MFVIDDNPVLCQVDDDAVCAWRCCGVQSDVVECMLIGNDFVWCLVDELKKINK